MLSQEYYIYSKTMLSGIQMYRFLGILEIKQRPPYLAAL